MVAGAPTLDERGPSLQVLQGRSGELAFGERREGGSDSGQAVQARPTLPGRLQGQVANDPGRLDDPAAVGWKCDQHPGADDSTERAQVGVAEREVSGLRGEPRTVVAADEHRARRVLSQ